MKNWVVLLLFLFTNGVQARPLEKLTPKEMAEKVKLFEPVSLKDAEIELHGEYIHDCGVSYRAMITLKNKTYEFELTLPDSKEPVPIVVGIPTIKGPTILESHLSVKFCELGIAYAIADVMPLEFDLSKNGIYETDKAMINGVRAIRMFLDYAATQPFAYEFLKHPVDVNRVGVLGLSNGGTLATLLAAVDPRVKATVVMGSPGNIPQVLATSAETKVDEFRTVQMEHHGLATSEQYENFLRERISVSPIQLAPLIRKDSFFQVVIDPDIVVPTADQTELWEVLGRPRRLDIEGGHTSAIISMVLLESYTLSEFLEDKLIQ